MFNHVKYVLYKGRFTGASRNGEFSVPYEITASATPAEGNHRILVEVPHFADGPITRRAILGPEFLFGNRFIHATVGYSTLGTVSLTGSPASNHHP